MEKKYDFFPDLAKTGRNSALIYALSRQYELILTESESIKNKDFESFLDFVTSQLPKGDEFLHVRWILQIMKNFGNENSSERDQLGYEIALNDFLNLNNKITQNIIPHMKLDGLTDKIAHTVCFYILSLRDMNPGIFYTILSYFEGILVKVNISRVNRVVGPECLSFYEKPDIEFFKQMKTEEPMIQLFFQYPIIFQNLEFSYSLQHKYTNDYKYPLFLSFAGRELSHVNTTIDSGSHFLDTYSKAFLNFLLTAKDVSVIPEHLNQYPQLINLMILVHQPTIYKNFDRYMPLLNKEFNHSLTTDIIQRFKNDRELINVIAFFTTNELTPDEIVQHSLALHLEFSFGNSQLLDYASMKFYLISDQDSQTDFDFIRCYQLLRTFLSCFKQPTKLLDQNIEKIKTLLDTIANRATQSLVIYDLFSIIFIQDKQGKYVCHQAVAQKLVKLLVSYDVSPYIAGADMLFLSKKPKRKEAANLQAYLVKDHSVIYKAIEEGNWTLANQLTEFIPYFRKLYIRSYGMSFIANNQQVPPEIEKERRTILFDFALSTFNQEVLKNAIPIFKKYTDFINVRLQFQDAFDLMSCLGNYVKHAKAVEKVNEISEKIEETIANEKIQEYIQNFDISKNLYSFVDNLDLYYHCALMQFRSIEQTNVSTETVFQFDMRRALSGPFNNGEFEKSQKLADIGKIQLFEFVVHNLKWFKVQPQLLQSNIDEYLVETTYLALENKFYNFLTSQKKVSENVKIYIKQEETKKTIIAKKNPFTAITEIVRNTSSSSKNLDEIDDFLYNVDHQELYNYLIKTYRPTQFPDELIKVLDVVSYVAPQSDRKTIETIRLYNLVHSITKATNPQKIITDLMKSDLFDMSVKFIKVCLSKDSWGPPVCHLFSLCTSNHERMDLILSEFSSRFDLIESRFFHVPGVLPHLLAKCPPEKRNEVRALALLPEEITIDSNIFDFNTVARSFARHVESIFKINDEIAAIFADEHFLLIIHSIEAVANFYKIFAFLYRFFENKETVIEIWTTKILESIKQIEVDSIESEEESIKFFKNQAPMFAVLPKNDQRVQKIRVIVDFLNFRPFARYKKAYSFYEFDEHNTFAEYLIDHCIRIDSFSIAEDISKAFDARGALWKFQMKRLETLIWTQDFTRAKEAIEKTPDLLLDANDPENTVYDRTYFKLHPLTKVSLFDRQEIDILLKSVPILSAEQHQRRQQQQPNADGDTTNLEGLLNVYERVKMINKLNLEKEKQDFLPYFIQKMFLRRSAISLLISFKLTEEALTSLFQNNTNHQNYRNDRKINDKSNEQLDIFIFSIYRTALSSDNITKTQKYIISKDPALDKTRNLWNGLCGFFESHRMFDSLYKVLMLLNRLEEAALAEMKLFGETESLPRQIMLLGHAIYCLTDALHCRENPNDTKTPPFVPMKSNTFEDVEKEKSMFEFMLKLCDVCNDRGIPFKSEYNLIDGENATASLAAMLFLNGESALLEELAKISYFTMSEVYQKACLTLAREKIPNIVMSLRLINSTDPRFAAVFLDELLNEMAMGPNHGGIISIIMTCYRDPTIQCKKMIEYDFLGEASLIIISNKLFDLLPLVAARAAQLGLADLIQTCKKYI